MNNYLYRLVFNKARGLIMVVAETTRSNSKTKGQTRCKHAAAASLSICVSRLRFSLWAALGMVSFIMPVNADIIVDKSTPTQQQPTVLTAANGVTQVNIQTASAGGVSRNSYTEFDVDKQGVILNNSRSDVQTQLGGWVEANPWLAKGEARIILNEVNSSNRSQLLGYIEVAGGRAQVIVANAAGITCDGCGFINASQAYLTTASPTINGGNLKSFSVNGGVVRIEGAGLDARQTDYAALMARAVEINAGIWANKLDVIAGAHQIDSAHSGATPVPNTGASPAFAVDVSKLGGMYAGQIRLVGTEAGVGVRNAGTLGATAGSVTVTADGIIENSGNITASALVQLDTQNTIQNSGTLYAQGDTQITSKDGINNSGVIAAKSNTSLTTTGVGSGIISTQDSVLGAGVNADGTLATSGNLNLAAASAINVHGKSLSGDNQTFVATSINLSGSNNSADNLNLTAIDGDITLTSATLATNHRLTAATTQTLRTDHARVAADQLTFSARDLSNVMGELVQVGTGDLTLHLAGNLNNEQGRIATNSHNLSINAADLTNTNGKLEHAGAGKLSLEAGKLNNIAGAISSHSVLDIEAASILSDKGSLSAEQLHIDSTLLSNRSGNIIQRGSSATQIASAQFDNTNGSVTSNGATTLTLGSLANQGGKIQVGTEATQAELAINAAGTVANGRQQGTRGSISATGNTSINADILDNSEGDITSRNSLIISTTKTLNNQQGLLAGEGAVSIQGNDVDNTQGTMGSLANDVKVTASTGKLNNSAGRIEAAQAVSVSGAGINNNKGVITGNRISANSQLDLFDNSQGALTSTGAGDALNMQTGALVNDAGLIQAQGKLTINTHGQTLTNTHSSTVQTAENPLGILGLGAVNLSTGVLDNTTGYIGSLGALTAESSAVKNTQGGSISSADTLFLKGTTLDNQGGQIQALGDTTLSFSDSIDNRGSLIRTNKTLSINTTSLNNANTFTTVAGDSKIQPDIGIDAHSIDVTATELINTQGALRAGADLTLSSHGTVENNQGLISAGATATVKDTASTERTLQVNNTSGTLIAGQSLSVTSASLAGDGDVLSEGDLVLSFVGDYSNTTHFQANGSASLTTTGTFTNLSSLRAGTALTLNATTIENQASADISAQQLSLNATDTLNNRGLINGNGTFVTATNFNNIGTGKIYGDHIAISAVTLTNDVETSSTGETKSAVIAARERLDIGAQTINNREHAALFSLEDMAIGGGLDAVTYTASGQAKVLNNESASIEALGILDLSVQQINNINKHMATQKVTRTEKVVDYEGILSNKGVGKIYREGSPGVSIVNHESNYLRTPEQEYQQWQAYRYTSTITETQLVSSDPARISSSAAMNINANTLINSDSIIVAGGAITNRDAIDNLSINDTPAIRTITNVGTLTDYYRDFESGRDRTGHHGPYKWEPAPIVKTFQLIPEAGYDVEGANPINSGIQVAALTTGAVTETPAGVAAAVVDISKAPAINFIIEIPLVTTSAADANQEVVRTSEVNTQLPNNSLYRINPSTNASYLVETDPSFTDNRLWLNSDYMLDALAFDPAMTQTRLGDGFYEQQLIREQIELLTGRRFLEDYSDDEAQYLALMNNAATYLQDYNLRPGVALSAEQMAALTSDIVWLVETSVTLADGTITKVLVPQVYVRVDKNAIDGTGALISGDSIDLKFTGDVSNSGTVAGRAVIKLDAQTIENLGGRVSAETLNLKARQDLLNLGGKMDAVNSLSVNAGRDIKISSTTITGTSTQGSRTQVDRVAGLYVTGGSGNLIVTAGRDAVLDAAQLINKSPTGAAAGITSVTAGNNLAINSLKETENHTVGGNFKTSADSEVGSVIYTEGMLQLKAGNNLGIKASELNAAGSIAMEAGNDITSTSVANEQHYNSKNNGHTISDASVKNSLVDITSGGAVTIKAGNDATLTGTNITSADDTAIRARGDTTITAVIDSESHYGKDSKKSLGRHKTTTAETLNETVVGGTINSGGDLLINAHKNSEGKIIGEESGTTNLTGVTLLAKKDVAIAADEDVNITGINYASMDYSDTKKSSGFGISKKDKGSVELENHLQNAHIEAGGNAHIVSGDDINLAATNVVVDGNINLQAVDNLLVTAGEAMRSSEEWSTKSGMFSDGAIYSASEHKAGEGLVGAQSSNLIAGGKVTAATGTGQIIASNIRGDEGVTLISDAGDFDILSVRTSSESYSHDQTVSVGLGDVGKSLTRPDELIKTNGGRASVKLAEGQFDSEDKHSNNTAMLGSSIQSNKNVTVIARAGRVNIEGSVLAADADGNKDGTLGLAAATGVNVTEAKDSYDSKIQQTQGTAELSLVVQHQAVEVANASKAVEQAKEQLEQAKKDYTAFERNLDQLQTQLAQIENDYANKVPGVAYQDVLDLREQVKDSEGYKEWYQAGIALAAVNVTSSVTALVQQTKTLADSGSTYGFNAGLQLDVDASKNISTDSSTTAQASYLSGNNILIQTGTANVDGTLNRDGTNTTIRGSHLSANAITIQTGELNLLNSVDTSKQSHQAEQSHVTSQMTVFGASGGASVNGSVNRSKDSNTSTTINNTTLNADQINLDTTGDTNLRGANVHADSQLIANIGGDLNIESQQNRARSNSDSAGISGGFSLGGENNEPTLDQALHGDSFTNNIRGAADVGSMSGVNGGVNASNGISTTRETVLTSLTSGGTANIKVSGNTQITAALIGTIDAEGNATNHLTLDTKTLSFTDLRNTEESNQVGGNLSSNFSLVDGNKDPASQTLARDGKDRDLRPSTSNLTYENSQSNDASKTLATLGHGNITVGDAQLEQNGELTDAGKASDSALRSLNRDSGITEKELWNSEQSQAVDTTLDHRLLTESGRKEIKNDFIDTGEFGQDIGRAAIAINQHQDLGVTDFLNTLGNNIKGTDLKNDLLRNPENAHIVDGLKSQDGDIYAKAVKDLGVLAQIKFGFTQEELGEIHLYDSSITTSSSLTDNLFKDVKGGTVLDENNTEYAGMFIDAGDGASKTDQLSTLGHETIEYFTLRTDAANDSTQEAQANVFGVQLSNRINQAAGGDLDSTGTSSFNISLINSGAVASGTKHANLVEDSEVDNRRLNSQFAMGLPNYIAVKKTAGDLQGAQAAEVLLILGELANNRGRTNNLNAEIDKLDADALGVSTESLEAAKQLPDTVKQRIVTMEPSDLCKGTACTVTTEALDSVINLESMADLAVEFVGGALISAGVDAYKAVKAGGKAADEVATNAATDKLVGVRAEGDFGKLPPNQTYAEIQTTSGIVIKTTQGKTTTVLGAYLDDTRNIIDDQLILPKNPDYLSGNPGGYNMLNVPDKEFLSRTPAQFWEEVNEPFLEAAVQRGDEIYLATKPMPTVLDRLEDGKIVRSGFGKEYDYLYEKGYRYNENTGKMIKVK